MAACPAARGTSEGAARFASPWSCAVGDVDARQVSEAVLVPYDGKRGRWMPSVGHSTTHERMDRQRRPRSWQRRRCMPQLVEGARSRLGVGGAAARRATLALVIAVASVLARAARPLAIELSTSGLRCEADAADDTAIAVAQLQDQFDDLVAHRSLAVGPPPPARRPRTPPTVWPPPAPPVGRRATWPFLDDVDDLMRSMNSATDGGLVVARKAG